MHMDKRRRRHQPREKLLAKPAESAEPQENSTKCESVAGRTVHTGRTVCSTEPAGSPKLQRTGVQPGQTGLSLASTPEPLRN